MGYLDGWWGRRSDDPLQDLDPKAREFLKKESPLKYDSSSNSSSQSQDGTPHTPRGVAAAAAATTQAQAQSQSQADATKAAAAATKGTTAAAAAAAAAAAEKSPGQDAGAVPAESLYQDGRYAHLWKTYRPLAEVENETKTDTEKLQDVLEAFKARKAAIGTAALENCADEQMDWSNCMRGGSLRARMTMCSDEVRKFERCFNMQSRLLKALGYLNALDRSPETDERIQLHADKLYHQMLEQDAAVEAAKKEGRPIPKFEPVIPKQAAGGDDDDSATARMSEAAKKRAAEALAKLTPEERAAEEAAIEAEMRSKAEMVGKIKDLWKEQETEREARRQKGEETVWDKATAAFRYVSGSSGENKG